ncbi:hypothetical protein Tco_1549047 [Tanacetum coccineum]
MMTTPEDVIRRRSNMLLTVLPLYSPNNRTYLSIPRLFTDEHTLDNSSHPRYDDADDDLFDLKTDNDEWGKYFMMIHLTPRKIKSKITHRIKKPLGARRFWPSFTRAITSLSSIIGNGYSLKDKNEAKTDKTEHGIGKSVKSPFPCQILTVVGVDGNNRIYPLAYTIVEAESKRLCVKHIHESMKSEFKGGVYKDMLWNAARATIVVEFNKNMGQLKLYNSAAYDWNASSQADGSSQQKKGPRQGAGARNASSQTAGSSQPSVAPSQASQGPSQHSVGPTQASQGPKKGFQAPIPTPYYRPQRLTKKSSSRQPSETTILF